MKKKIRPGAFGLQSFRPTKTLCAESSGDKDRATSSGFGSGDRKIRLQVADSVTFYTPNATQFLFVLLLF